MQLHMLSLSAALVSLAACSEAETASTDQADPAIQPALTAIAETLAPFGDGYPDSGDPCRRLGESAATQEYLDDSAILVGCATQAQAEALAEAENAEMIGEREGAFLLSVPFGNTMTESDPAAQRDAMVAGTEYNATTILDCGFDGEPPTQSCNAGVKRNWGEEAGEHLVEVQKPDGRTRAIFFRGTEPYSADSAQSDGSAGWDFETSRNGDRVTITYGPETYVVVDALITGG